MPTTETAILAGGCFWGAQDLIRRQPGVISTRVGYSGGDVTNATYRNHGTHAEAVEIVFDPDQDQLPPAARVLLPDPRPHDQEPPGQRRRHELPLGDLLHLATSRRRVAEDTIADVNASKLWPGKVVTEVAAAGPFWEAEPEHQDYLIKHPGGYTCHFVRPNWVLPKRAESVAAE